MEYIWMGGVYVRPGIEASTDLKRRDHRCDLGDVLDRGADQDGRPEEQIAPCVCGVASGVVVCENRAASRRGCGWPAR